MKVLKKFASIIIAGMFDDSGVEYGGICGGWRIDVF